jgi:hypothetical protein
VLMARMRCRSVRRLALRADSRRRLRRAAGDPAWA